jgi:hypothetical protein
MAHAGGTAHTLRGAAIAALAATAALSAQAAPAAAATTAPTITSAFTPALIGATGSTSLSVTITNPEATASLSSIAFTDSLPADLTIDDPNGENGSCGATSVVTANPGSQTLSLTGGSLKPGAACTVSVSLVAASAGSVQNDTGPVSSSAGASAAGDTETLTVLPPPTLTVTGIKNNARYTYGKVVRPHFTCAQPFSPADLEGCSALDDLNNTINSGGALDTKVPGAHSLVVSATSDDGLVTTDTINYTVLPDNVFTIAKVTPKSSGSVVVQLALPGRGKVQALALAGKTTFAKATVKVAGTINSTTGIPRKVTVKVTLAPTPAGTALLTAGTATSVKLEISYTPTGGVVRTLTKHAITVG